MTSTEAGALIGLGLLASVMNYFHYNSAADMGLSGLAILVYSRFIFRDVQLLMDYEIWGISALYSDIVTVFLDVMRILHIINNSQRGMLW